MKVKDVMSESVTCCATDTPLQDVAALMVDCDCGEIPVMDARGATGRGDHGPRHHPPHGGAGTEPADAHRVGVRMTSPAVTVEPELSLGLTAPRRSSGTRSRRAPVADASGHLIGIVSWPTPR